MFTEHFLARGYEVFSAARAIFSKESPKIFILDLNLQGEFGGDLLKDIRAICPMAKIIILTANDDPELQDKLVSQGADSF